MIFLLSDFGQAGPYVGQVEAVLERAAPGTPRISLFHDLPQFRPDLAAYLVPAYSANQPPGTIFLCVVDPGVGGARRAVALNADDRWFIGPDNGLFAIVARRATVARWWSLTANGGDVAPTFHGRDLFAPAAASIATGGVPHGKTASASTLGEDWPDDLPQVVYIDHYGNLMTGVRAAALGKLDELSLGGVHLARATRFGDVPPGAGFWYENANGLAEIAVNQGSAQIEYAANLGDAVGVHEKAGGGSSV